MFTPEQLRDEIVRLRPQYAGRVRVSPPSRDLPNDRTVVVQGLGSASWANMTGQVATEAARIVALFDDMEVRK